MIINIGSYAALHGSPGRAAYAATKEAIRGLSRSAARDWGKHGIRVNVINPVARTPAVQRRVTPEVLQAALASTALGYQGDPERQPYTDRADRAATREVETPEMTVFDSAEGQEAVRRTLDYPAELIEMTDDRTWAAFCALAGAARRLAEAGDPVTDEWVRIQNAAHNSCHY